MPQTLQGYSKMVFCVVILMGECSQALMATWFCICGMCRPELSELFARTPITSRLVLVQMVGCWQAGSYDQTIRLWDGQTGNFYAPLSH